MEQPLDIAEIVRRTGLTARALRFYEARGLVAPLRTASGRRIYDRRALDRLARIVALKAAGFSLARIAALLDGQARDLGRVIRAQLDALDQQAARLDEARRLLLAAQSRIGRGEPLDAETLCSLIRQGERTMEHENWKTVADRHFTEEEKAHWAANPAPPGFDQEAYARQWKELGERIAARLPLDPASAQAQALLGEWQALLAPFTAVATPQMQAGAARLYDRMGEWEGDMKPPFPATVWAFIKAASAARG